MLIVEYHFIFFNYIIYGVFFVYLFRSRRVPTPVAFDPTNSLHTDFVMWHSVLLTRALGGAVTGIDDPQLLMAFRSKLIESTVDSSGNAKDKDVDVKSVKKLLSTLPREARQEIIAAVQPQEFEKVIIHCFTHILSVSCNIYRIC